MWFSLVLSQLEFFELLESTFGDLESFLPLFLQMSSLPSLFLPSGIHMSILAHLILAPKFLSVSLYFVETFFILFSTLT